MSTPFDILDEEARERLERAKQPSWTDPMLATLTDDHFSDPDWIYERKLDGERCLVFKQDDEVRMLSRNRKSLDDTYPELVEAMEAQPAEAFVVDGEIVAFRGDVTSFSRLQQRMQIRDPEKARTSRVAVHLYVFDLLHLEGRDCTGLALRDRKRLLRGALEFDRRVRFMAHRNEHGEAWLEEACRKGWEGLIAKRAAGTYVHGRSRDWLKFKCVNRQEFVIGGFTEPEGERRGFGALVVGYHEDDTLVCAGKVGTGFDDDLLASLGRRLRSRERKTSPFGAGPEPSGRVHWVRPDLVGEVAFTEWTGEGSLRHPRFLGLRRDKDAEDVVRERPGASS